MILIFLFLLLHAQPGQPCTAYEPKTVTLTGTMKPHTLPGPPNYESVANGDAPEQIWILHLAKPICVAASEDSEKESGVSDLQLVFIDGQKQYSRYRPLLNRNVMATGTLFHAQTGHHHTKVLLTVRTIKKR